MDKDVLEKALDYLKETQEFVIDQAPEVIIQILRYEKISCIFGLIFSCIGIFLLLSFAFYCIFFPKLDNNGYRDCISVMGCFIPFALITPLFVSAITLTDRLLKIYISPKYFLIDLLINKIR